MKVIKFSLIFAFIISCNASAKAIPQRVVSVGGAITEIIYALDQGEKIVGSDTTSYYPDAATKTKKVGYHRSLSAEGILSLKPNLIICDEESGPPEVLQQIKNSGVEILTLKSDHTISGLINKIRKIGEILNAKTQGEAVIADIRLDIDRLQEIQKSVKNPKKVIFLLQHSGAPMVAGIGTAADGIIKLSGAINAAKDFSGYKILSSEALISLNPDVILTSNQDGIDNGISEKIMQNPAFVTSNAVKNNRIIVMDSLFLLGFGPRTAEAALELAEKINE